MSFGQPTGPPATHKQVNELLDLLQRAGHSDFRDARGPMGFTQRQAGGKFTRDEADEFISQLSGNDDGTGLSCDTNEPVRRAEPNADARLTNIPTEALAAELQCRGWVVLEP